MLHCCKSVEMLLTLPLQRDHLLLTLPSVICRFYGSHSVSYRSDLLFSPPPTPAHTHTQILSFCEMFVTSGVLLAVCFRG
jgi:hypothetical protein